LLPYQPSINPPTQRQIGGSRGRLN